MALGIHSAVSKIASCFNYARVFQVEEDQECRKDNFRCKQRLCPRCSYQTSANIERETISAVELLQKQYPGLRIYYVTLTLPPRYAEDVSHTFDRLKRAFTTLLRCHQFADSLLGTFRGIHLKHSTEKGLINVHVHALFVFKSTFQSRHYVSNAQWLNLWRRSFQDYSITHVNVEKVRPYNNHHTLAEAAGAKARYAADSKDLLNLFEYSQLDKISLDSLRTIYSALEGRRLHFFTGELNKSRPGKITVLEPDDSDHTCSPTIEERVYE